MDSGTTRARTLGNCRTHAAAFFFVRGARSSRRFGAAPTAFAPPFFAALAATKLAYEAPRSVLIFASTASVFFSSPVAARRWRRVGAAR